MLLQPYLVFEGRCEEALEFYKQALGAKVEMLLRFKDSPEPPPPGQEKAGIENKIMHASVRIGETTIMASDGRCESEPKFQGINLSLTVSSPEEAGRVFAGLSNGGQVYMPLTKTFFSPSFGMLADRFGVTWMILARQ